MTPYRQTQCVDGEYLRHGYTRFDLNLLIALDALLAEQNVSRAARRLYLSQSATSAALARLRRLLGDPLLVRQGARMVATPFAERLKGPVRSILTDIERTLSQEQRFDAAVSQRTFRIAATDYAAFTVVARLAERLQRQAPGVTLEVWPLEDGVHEQMGSGAIDLAVADEWSLRTIETRRTLFTESFICVVRASHPRIGRRLTLGGFVREKHVLVSPRGRVQGNVDSALAAVGKTREVAVTVPHFLAAPAIVARTNYILTIAERVARAIATSRSLRLLKPPVDVPGFAVAMAWHARTSADGAAEWLRREVARAAEAL